MGKLDGRVLVTEMLLDMRYAGLNSGIDNKRHLLSKILAGEGGPADSLVCLVVQDCICDESVELPDAHSVEHCMFPNESRNTILADNKLQSLITPAIRRVT